MNDELDDELDDEMDDEMDDELVDPEAFTLSKGDCQILRVSGQMVSVIPMCSKCYHNNKMVVCDMGGKKEYYGSYFCANCGSRISFTIVKVKRGDMTRELSEKLTAEGYSY